MLILFYFLNVQMQAYRMEDVLPNFQNYIIS